MVFEKDGLTDAEDSAKEENLGQLKKENEIQVDLRVRGLILVLPLVHN